MPAPACSDAEFIRTWQALKSSPRVAAQLGVSTTNVVRRRRAIEVRHGLSLETEDHYGREAYQSAGAATKQRANLALKDGVLVVFSDAHYWPGEPTVAHRALLAACRALKPKAVIANGDVFDGASVSRHPPQGWEKPPTLIEELRAVQARLGEVKKAAKGAQLFRTRGNHDLRFERHLAMHASQFRDVHGMRLTDHLPDWAESWSVFVNGHTVVKHRFANGLHAAYNNTLRAGTSMVTGHLHSLKVTPWTDYNGTRYGVDTGTLAEPTGPQFEYAEDGPANHRAGFAVLTFKGGHLLPPELVEVARGTAWFRGRALA